MGQVACAAIRHGSTRAEIEREIAKCGIGGRRTPAETQQALAVAEQALESSNSELTLDSDILRRFVSITAPLVPIVRFGAKFLGRRIGAVAAGLIIVRQIATARLEQVVVQRAANQAALNIIRRAAANEARFLRSGTQ